MKVTETRLPGVLLIEPKVYGDSRGFFKETFQAERYRDSGIKHDFVQDNYSRSQKGVLRGLHFQIEKPQGKLVSCLKGMVFDVVVDINSASDTFGQWYGVELSEDNHRQLWIPPGYAHGFYTMSEVADFHYKCTQIYDSSDEGGIHWEDPELNIAWPVPPTEVSIKDQKWPLLKELADKLQS